MSAYEEEEPGILQKYRVIIGCGLAAAIAITVWFGQRHFDRPSRSRHEQNVILVNLPPSQPPPPPPPPSQLPPTLAASEQQMVAQEPVNAMESKPDETSKNEPPASEAPALGTSIQGNGPPDGFGLHGGNSFFGGGTGKMMSHGSSSRWGWYANQVQGTISQALQGDANTRTADFRIVVQIWSDRAGRITRARLAGSTGSVALDKAITNEVLGGLILQEPPPDGMPMPIVLRLTARHSQAALSRQYP